MPTFIGVSKNVVLFYEQQKVTFEVTAWAWQEGIAFQSWRNRLLILGKMSNKKQNDIPLGFLCLLCYNCTCCTLLQGQTFSNQRYQFTLDGVSNCHSKCKGYRVQAHKGNWDAHVCSSTQWGWNIFVLLELNASPIIDIFRKTQPKFCTSIFFSSFHYVDATSYFASKPAHM